MDIKKLGLISNVAMLSLTATLGGCGTPKADTATEIQAKANKLAATTSTLTKPAGGTPPTAGTPQAGIIPPVEDTKKGIIPPPTAGTPQAGIIPPVEDTKKGIIPPPAGGTPQAGIIPPVEDTKKGIIPPPAGGTPQTGIIPPVEDTKKGIIPPPAGGTPQTGIIPPVEDTNNKGGNNPSTETDIIPRAHTSSGGSADNTPAKIAPIPGANTSSIGSTEKLKTPQDSLDFSMLLELSPQDSTNILKMHSRKKLGYFLGHNNDNFSQPEHNFHSARRNYEANPEDKNKQKAKEEAEAYYNKVHNLALIIQSVSNYRETVYGERFP